MNTNTMVARHQAANLLALQCALRVGGLLGIGVIGSIRKTLDTYLLCLQHGASYVKNARLDVAEIALLLGYSEQSAFTRAFRSWTGVTPALWRRQHLLDAA